MYKIVLLRQNGEIELFTSLRVPTVKHKKIHTEIRGKNLAGKTFVLIISRCDSAKVEFTN